MSYFNNIGFLDENGLPYGVKHVQNKPRVSSMDYLYDIAEGNVTGHTPWTKIGYNPALTTEEDIWSAGGLYVFPAAATQMEVVSSLLTANVNMEQNYLMPLVTQEVLQPRCSMQELTFQQQQQQGIY